jgi:endonuclease YncB( thermonuclease family)
VPQPHRGAYISTEKQARATGAGLWRDGDQAMPPWAWRKAMKDGSKLERAMEEEQ